VVEPVAGRTLGLADLQAPCRQQLAGYTVPREPCLVDHMVRSPSVKADDRWARDGAAESREQEGPGPVLPGFTGCHRSGCGWHLCPSA
jgi:hypothetical protein